MFVPYHCSSEQRPDLMQQSYTFSKEEKLKSRKLIGRIFEEGHVVKAYPIRIQFIFHDYDNLPTAQAGFSVPKRNFKLAVDRNRIKRQLKEVYRLHKADLINLLERRDKKMSLMIICTTKEKLPYETLEKLILKAIAKIKV